jgi:hypothetical protein
MVLEAKSHPRSTSCRLSLSPGIYYYGEDKRGNQVTGENGFENFWCRNCKKRVSFAVGTVEYDWYLKKKICPECHRSLLFVHRDPLYELKVTKFPWRRRLTWRWILNWWRSRKILKLKKTG